MSEIKTLYTLRGFAALLVIASHCGIFFLHGQGGNGVFLFYVLSAYLLTKKLRLLNLTAQNISNYFLSRFMRIYPPYILTIFVYLFFNVIVLDWHSAIQHFTLIRGDSFFWSIPAECRFYLVLPIIVGVQKVISRNRIFIFLYLFLLAAVSSHSSFYFFTTFFHNGAQFSMYPHVFIVGCTLAYFEEELTAVLHKYFHILFLISFLSFIVTSNYFANLFGLPQVNGWAAPLCHAIFSGILILSSQHVDSHLLVSRVGKYFGEISFGLYLYHMLVIHFLTNYFDILNPFPLFFLTVFITVFVASVSYFCIEKKSIQLGKRMHLSRI